MAKTTPKSKPKSLSREAKSNAEASLVKGLNRARRPYPKRSIQIALNVANAIKDKNGGNSWASKEVAKAIGVGAATQEFYYITASSRDYGLTEGTRDTAEISLTPFGRSVVYPASSKDAIDLRIQAFFKVELFKKVYEHYGSGNLPEREYVSNTLQTQFGIDPLAHDEFLKVFRENCDFLGIAAGLPESRRPSASNGHQPSPESVIVTLGETRQKKGHRCFVVMPFRERQEARPIGFFNEVLNSLILPAATEAGFDVSTANRLGSDVIQATIVNDLLDADLVVIDLTEHNPNVLFELGLRMAEDKPVALIREKGTPAIFDVDNLLRVFDYNPNLWSSTIKHDVAELTKHIRASWEQRENQMSYIKILRGQK